MNLMAHGSRDEAAQSGLGVCVPTSLNTPTVSAKYFVGNAYLAVDPHYITGGSAIRWRTNPHLRRTNRGSTVERNFRVFNTILDPFNLSTKYYSYSMHLLMQRLSGG